MKFDRPHVYFKNGAWKCARKSGVWLVWPYGRGNTPLSAYCDFLRRMLLDVVV